ncbi:MAG: replication protein P [Halieaceae bacterium]|nr:replication protein P [Halieaceae bacterium]
MQHSKELIQRAVHDLEASPKTSTTAVGRDKSGTEAGADLIDTINQVFTLFRLNYHNQFYAAYSEQEQLIQVKRLWQEALAPYPLEHILRGARQAMRTSEYLPTLNRMLECCQDSLGELGLPDARSAYLEACRAGSPKSAQAWSHPAVYLAGRDSGWFLLANNAEKITWPLFRSRYRDYCEKVLAGQSLQVPAAAALPDAVSKPSSKKEALAEIAKLKQTLSRVSSAGQSG